MSRRRAWILNLEAELELELAGRAYTPSRHLRQVVARQARRLVGSLVRPDDLVLDAAEERDAKGCVGLAWCPTPSALARLRAAGAEVGPVPTLESLQRVNARPFAARVRASLEGPSFPKHVVSSLEEARSVLAREAPLGWLVRRTFGAAGRGRRRIAGGGLEPGEERWLEASLRRGPLVIEAWVQVTGEYTRSGWVESDGSVRIAPPCAQSTTREGAWLGTRALDLGSVRREEDRGLEAAAEAAGNALAQAGYFGPFGIDAFRYRSAPGAREILQPLSEINARFTMDWTSGWSLKALVTER